MPGTPPQGWQAPKTSYDPEDVLTPEQFERIEGNAYATELGERTIDPSQSPTGVVGTLRQLLDWFANRIRAITGTTNWHDAPPTTLTAAKSHIDAAAPHSGHETPTGAQTKVNAHANLTAAHSATSNATANRIIVRDAAGRAKVAAPVAANDIARKDTVDAKFHETTGHKHTGVAGDGPVIPFSSVAIAPGDYLLAASTAQEAISGTTPVYTKGIQVFAGGSYRTRFTIYAVDVGFPAYGRVYVNGTARGTIRSVNDQTPLTFTEDISGISPGDTIQVFTWMSNAAHYGSITGFQVLVSSYLGATVVT